MPTTGLSVTSTGAAGTVDRPPTEGERRTAGQVQQHGDVKTVRPPANIQEGGEVTFKVNARWLVGQDVCVPGKGQWEVKLPVRKQSNVANAAVFGEWKDKFPVKANEEGSPGKVETKVVAKGK